MTASMPALERLAKWRMVFAGWQLGTRPLGDPESDAVRNHREATLIQRAELSALTQLLVAKGIFTEAEFGAALEAEAEQLSKDLEHRFPGFKATDIGMQMDARAAETTRGWRP